MTRKTAKRRERAIVRSAVPKDLEVLLRLEQRCFRGIYAEHRLDTRRFAYYLSNPDAIVLLVFRGGEDPRGYLLGLFGNGTWGHLSRVLSLAVEPKRRGAGFGRLLLTRYITRSRRSGRDAITAEVWVGNRAAAISASGCFEPVGDPRGGPVGDIRLKLSDAELRWYLAEARKEALFRLAVGTPPGTGGTKRNTDAHLRPWLASGWNADRLHGLSDGSAHRRSE